MGSHWSAIRRPGSAARSGDAARNGSTALAGSTDPDGSVVPDGSVGSDGRAARDGIAGQADRDGWRVPAVVVVVLVLGACAQAFTDATEIVRDHLNGAPLVYGQVMVYALPLCLVALVTTVPLALRRPVAAAITVTVATAVMLAWVQRATVAGVIAVLLAAFRVGTVPSAPAPSALAMPRASVFTAPARAVRAVGPGQLAAAAIAVSFLSMALATPHVAQVLLAAGVPIAAGAGIAVRAGRSASSEDEARSVLTDTLTEHLARGERARIARELHDVVAHHISMIAVRAETARLTTPGMPQAGAERLLEIGDTARAGLAEMRRLLGVLREDVAAEEVAVRQPQPGLAQVATLVDEAREASGSAMRLIVSGQVAAFDPGLELVAYRIAQEALTNARRHAPGAAVDVELRYDDDTLRLRIRDNGPGLTQDGTPTGHGLLGMRERAATVGGTVHTGAAPGGGFLVEAILPVKPDGVVS